MISPRRGQRAALHLLWTLPLAAAVAFVMVGAAVFAWCGVWGCEQRSPSDATPAVIGLLAAGLVMGLAVGLVPWTERRGISAAVATTVGLVATTGAAVYASAL
ncbi:hypothetical protein FA014_02955 [Cellulomonas hominis]|uniref:Uncharacterized protein n=1 Tax=Cellulomonas hominis TaxID=156981 RepID=A0A7Z8K1E5_9CELL|nr:hypothetical protein [Cellulomonas hominis]TKR26973.1 hypothetical protein FA014_02955 [Cellulomonas hominis]